MILRTKANKKILSNFTFTSNDGNRRAKPKGPRAIETFCVRQNFQLPAGTDFLTHTFLHR